MRFSHTIHELVYCVVLAVVALQIVVPPRLAVADLHNACQEGEEDGEPTEESETDGEEVLFETRDNEEFLLAPADLIQSQLRKRASRNALGRWVSPSAGGERAHWNGIGGPLRC